MSDNGYSSTRNHIIKIKGISQSISLQHIIYIESNNKRIVIHSARSPKTVECYQKIGVIAEELDKSFFRCHRCYIVNFKYVLCYERSAVRLYGGTEIPLSRRKYSQFASEFMTYTKSVGEKK